MLSIAVLLCSTISIYFANLVYHYVQEMNVLPGQTFPIPIAFPVVVASRKT